MIALGDACRRWSPGCCSRSSSKSVLYGSFVVIAAAFIVGGIVMLIVERFRPAPDVLDVDSLPVGRAFAIGSSQALALIPGVSRSGGTIVAGDGDAGRPPGRGRVLLLPGDADDGGGVRARSAGSAARPRHRRAALEIAIGFVMAFIASALVVKPFLQFVRRSGFAPFAWYRIALGLALLAAVAAGWL